MSPLGGTFDLATRSERLEEITRLLEQPKVWNDPERAQKLAEPPDEVPAAPSAADAVIPEAPPAPPASVPAAKPAVGVVG